MCGLILFFCLLGTIVDIAVSFMKPHSTPVNKSDGFMPVRDVSIATDHDRAPLVQNPYFGKNDSESDRTNLLHPSPGVNFSASITLTSFHQQSVRPSKCYIFIDLTLISGKLLSQVKFEKLKHNFWKCLANLSPFEWHNVTLFKAVELDKMNN